jgi:hypothetical protein
MMIVTRLGRRARLGGLPGARLEGVCAKNRWMAAGLVATNAARMPDDLSRPAAATSRPRARPGALRQHPAQQDGGVSRNDRPLSHNRRQSSRNGRPTSHLRAAVRPRLGAPPPVIGLMRRLGSLFSDVGAPDVAGRRIAPIRRNWRGNGRRSGRAARAVGMGFPVLRRIRERRPFGAGPPAQPSGQRAACGPRVRCGSRVVHRKRPAAGADERPSQPNPARHADARGFRQQARVDAARASTL